MLGARESRRPDRQRGRGPGKSFTHRLIEPPPPSNPPEGLVDPQSWPPALVRPVQHLEPGTNGNPHLRSLWLDFWRLNFSKMYAMCRVILQT